MTYLVIRHLAKFDHLLKVEHVDYQNVPQRSTCSVCKSGTLEIEITNESMRMPILSL